MPPTPEELDEEEAEFRALRRDLPGVKGAAEVGMLTVGVGPRPTPKNEFYRTNADFCPVVPLIDVEAGMDRHYIAVSPSMVEPLADIGIIATDHILYFTITTRGSLKIIPIRGPNAEGEMNEWHRTKELALIDGITGWYRMYSDSTPRRSTAMAIRSGPRSSPPNCFAWPSATRAV